jgi:regulatory protein
MARIVTVEEGAHGAVKAVADDGSLFLFRACYLASARGVAPFDLPDDDLVAAVEATEAEFRASALLARAEQFRAGLERKLAAKGLSRPACRAALDRLEAAGLLSDLRYAGSWIRQRVRSHAEGPRSLSAALASRGIERAAATLAIQEALESDKRFAMLLTATRILVVKGADKASARASLLTLGWRHDEVDDALEEMQV